MKLRKLIFWLHLSAGIFAGTIVLIMSITGVALMYQKQMTTWADRREYPVQAPADSERLPLASLVEKVREARPDADPTAITLYSEVPGLALVAAGQGLNLYVNAYTGEVLGSGAQGIRTFFRFMTDWHRYLGTTGPNRTTGKAITGACNLAFLFIVVSGIYIWWPKKWTRLSLRNVTWFRTGLAGRPRDFNWHNVFGFWCAIPLFLVVISATVISYPWASNLAHRIAGSAPPAPAAPAPGGPERERRAAPVFDLAGADTVLGSVEERNAEWKSINMRFPTLTDESVTFAIDEGNGGQPQLRSTVVVDKNTGQVVRTQGFSDQTPGQRFRSWLRFLHTGEFYGVTGQTIAGIASAAAVMLVCTGFSLSVRRAAAWLGRRRKRPELADVIAGGADLAREVTTSRQ